MKLQFFLLSLGVFFIQDCASMGIRTDKSLIKFLLDTRELSEANPARSNICFINNVPLLNNITDQFESNYAACLTSAANNRTLADAASTDHQQRLEETVAGVCGYANNCQAKNGSAIDIFNCYETRGAATAKEMYQVSANAVEYRQALEAQYSAIEGEQTKCTDAAERTYVEDTTQVYEEIHLCLAGKMTSSIQPKPTPPTITTITPQYSALPDLLIITPQRIH